jgi:repressor LexA
MRRPVPKANLTKKQLKVLDFIRTYRAKNRISPTLDEIAASFDVSKITIFEHVQQLRRKGVISTEKNMARSIRILDDDQEEPSVPILGHVAAGHPIHVEETPEHVRLEELLRLRSGCYLLRVTGTSMIDSHICDGDYVLVDPGARPENGQMVIAALEEGDVTLKRFHREKGRIRLQPANSALKPIYTKKLDLRGVVVGVLRRV